jgi:uncharacterized surface anchored protein
MSGADGSVVFSKVSPGNYTMQAQKNGYTTSTGKTSVTFGGTRELTIILQVVPTTGSLKITIIDSVGTAIYGAVVSSASQPSGQAALSGASSADGTVIFSNLLPGSYTVQASKEGYYSASGTVNIVAGTTGEVTISLQAVPTIGKFTVVVKDSSGAFLSGAIVSSTSQPTGQAALSGTTGADGTIEFNNLLPGTYAMQASKSGYVFATISRTVTAGSEGSTSFTLQMQASVGGGGISGFPIVATVIGVFFCVIWFWIQSNRFR